MFATKIAIYRLYVQALLLAVQTFFVEQKTLAREAAYRALRRFGTVAYAVDLDDDAVKAAIAEAVEAALAPLKTKNRELLGKLAKAAKGGEIDPADVERLEAELETARTQLADVSKQLKAANIAVEKTTKELEGEQVYTRKLVVENALVAELTAAGVPPGPLLKGALAMLKGEQIDVTVDGANRVAMIGGKPLPEFVKAWSAGEDGKQYVAAAGNAGGGATGGKTGAGGQANPWAKDTFNLTKQGELITQNPALATAMAAEHGVTV